MSRWAGDVDPARDLAWRTLIRAMPLASTSRPLSLVAYASIQTAGRNPSFARSWPVLPLASVF
jgi:hypothetical protein